MPVDHPDPHHHHLLLFIGFGALHNLFHQVHICDIFKNVFLVFIVSGKGVVVLVVKAVKQSLASRSKFIKKNLFGISKVIN